MKNEGEKLFVLLFILALIVLSIESCNDVANRKARVSKELLNK